MSAPVAVFVDGREGTRSHMLQPLQLEEVSIRYAGEIGELREFLAKSGIALNTEQTLGDLAARLREDRSFRRDLTSHVWVAVHSSDRQISYSDLLGMLALAAAGIRFAAAADEADAHRLLRFLMEARSSFDTASETGSKLPARWIAEPEGVSSTPLSFEIPEDGDDRRPVVWIAAAAACLLLALLSGIWLHHHWVEDHGMQTSSTSSAIPEASPAAVSADREISPLPRQHRETAAPRVQGAARQLPFRPLLGAATPPAAPANNRVLSKSPIASTASSANVAENPKHSASLRKPAPASSDRLSSNKPGLAVKVSPANPVERANNVPAASAAHGGFVRSTSLGIMAANVLYSPAPTYPAAASSLHVQGEVKLEAEVDRDGNVVSTRIISGPPLLQEAAADAVQRWHYRPFLYDGKPIGMNATVVVDFELPSL